MRKRWFFSEECDTVRKPISSLLYFKIVGNTFWLVLINLMIKNCICFSLFLIEKQLPNISVSFAKFSEICTETWLCRLFNLILCLLLAFLPAEQGQLKQKTRLSQPNSVNAYKTQVHKRQGQIQRACGVHNSYPGKCCLAFPLRSPAHQQQTSHHSFAPALSGNLALNEASSIYNSSAKIWWAHGLSWGDPEVLQAGSVAMPFF